MRAKKRYLFVPDYEGDKLYIVSADDEAHAIRIVAKEIDADEEELMISEVSSTYVIYDMAEIPQLNIGGSDL